MRAAHRFSGPGKPYEGLTKLGKKGPVWNGVVRLVPEQLDKPLRWKKPRNIFVNSMSDLFHPSLSNEDIAAVFGVMAAAPQHTFQVLTKRLVRMLAWFEWATGDGRGRVAAAAMERVSMHGRHCIRVAGPAPAWPLPNVMLGASIEDQPAADERIPLLLQTPAAVRFVSMEPLLSAVDLPGVWPMCNAETKAQHDEECGGGMFCEEVALDWVICGGESGPRARPMHPDWARSIRDQCVAAGVPFLFKGWGRWSPPIAGTGFGTGAAKCELVLNTGKRYAFPFKSKASEHRPTNEEYLTMLPRHLAAIGKKAAGRELDGRTWDGMPTTTNTGGKS